MFCNFCGKNVPDGQVCDCEGSRMNSMAPQQPMQPQQPMPGAPMAYAPQPEQAPMGYAPQPGQAPMGYAPQPGQAPMGYAPQPGQAPMGYAPQPGQAPMGYAPQPGQAPMGYAPQPGQAPMGYAPQPMYYPQQPAGPSVFTELLNVCKSFFKKPGDLAKDTFEGKFSNMGVIAAGCVYLLCVLLGTMFTSLSLSLPFGKAIGYAFLAVLIFAVTRCAAAGLAFAAGYKNGVKFLDVVKTATVSVVPMGLLFFLSSLIAFGNNIGFFFFIWALLIVTIFVLSVISNAELISIAAGPATTMAYLMKIGYAVFTFLVCYIASKVIVNQVMGALMYFF